ncbi:MAG: hypothetical protein DCC46_04785 [Armatimonadetes bacterium]|nr:MAG: hypothetical protein DCC46_04785 [Armatimonadota bacterium]
MGAQGQPPSAPPDNGVTFGVREDFPPFEYVDASGEVAGWDAEIVREAARIAGIEVRFVSGSLSEIRAQFENGEIDALAGMQWSEQRAQMARFTRPHFEVLYALYVRESESEPALKDFKGRRILVREGSLMADELARMGYGQDLVLVPSEAEALRRLANGEGDCAVAPQLVGDALQKGGKTMPVALGRTLLFRGKLCLVAQKGDVALAQAFDRAISELQRTGRYGELLAFAFADQGTDPNRPPGITYWLLLPVGGALLVAAAWYYTIRRQVVKKTLFIKEELQRSEAMREALANSELLYRSAIEATTMSSWARGSKRWWAFPLPSSTGTRWGRSPITPTTGVKPRRKSFSRGPSSTERASFRAGTGSSPFATPTERFVGCRTTRFPFWMNLRKGSLARWASSMISPSGKSRKGGFAR